MEKTTLIDITGQSFGDLFVIERHGGTDKGAAWLCECSCGDLVTVRGDHLRDGRRKFCVHAKHFPRTCQYPPMDHRGGAYARDTYSSWCSMHERCAETNPEHRSYRVYAARGIAVCERWFSFSAFLADMGPRPRFGYSIDRKDNDLGYEPGNCRWATAKQQGRNRRHRIYVEWKGKKVGLVELCDQFPVPSTIVRQRIRRGWPLDRALHEAVILKRRHRKNPD